MAGDGHGNARGTLSRADVAALLGVSVGSVRRLEGKELYPDVAADGTHLFREDEVRQLAASRRMRPSAERDADEPAAQIDAAVPRPAPPAAPSAAPACSSAPPPTGSAAAASAGAPGVRAATAFGLFNSGIGPREAVVQLEAEPADVRNLYEQWLAMGADLVVPAGMRQEMERLVGDDLSPAKLVAVIRRLVKCWEERHAFTYSCAGCGKEIEASPAREWKALVDAGCLAKWRHATCHATDSGRSDDSYDDDDNDDDLDDEE